MPTTPGRELMAQKAVNDFLSQTWRNKELIVACSGDYEKIQPFFQWVRNLRAAQVRTIFLPTEDNLPAKLGRIRNFTNDLADGDWLATWDDDDRHHPDRLSQHMRTASEQQADITYLNMQLHIFTDRNQIWWVDWRNHRSPGYVCYRKTDIRYDDTLSVGEDTIFLRKLTAAGYKFAPVVTEIPLYIRYFHGNNAWNRRHHEVLVTGHSASGVRIKQHENQIKAFLRLMKIKGTLNAVYPGGVVFNYSG